MKIIIHFGPPKTGTSAIQAWCSQNSEVLREKSIYYPAHKLNDNKISSGNLFAIFDKDESGSFTLNLEKVETLYRKAKASNLKTILLSSEFFFMLLPKLIEAFPQAKFLGYIRNPLEVLDSNYNQSIKRHGNTSKIPLTKHINCNSIKFIETYLTKYPNSDFELRAFTPSVFKNNSIVNDFLSYLSFEESIFVSKQLVNSSYAHIALEAKRWFNRLKLDGVEARLDTVLQAFEDGSESYTVIPDKYFRAYKSQVLGVLTKFTERFTVFGAESLLFEAKSAENPIYRPQDINTEEFKKVVAYIRNEDMNLFSKLKSSVIAHYGYETLEEKALVFYEDNEALQKIKSAYRRVLKS